MPNTSIEYSVLQFNFSHDGKDPVCVLPNQQGEFQFMDRKNLSELVSQYITLADLLNKAYSLKNAPIVDKNDPDTVYVYSATGDNKVLHVVRNKGVTTLDARDVYKTAKTEQINQIQALLRMIITPPNTDRD